MAEMRPTPTMHHNHDRENDHNNDMHLGGGKQKHLFQRCSKKRPRGADDASHAHENGGGVPFQKLTDPSKRQRLSTDVLQKKLQFLRGQLRTRQDWPLLPPTPTVGSLKDNFGSCFRFHPIHELSADLQQCGDLLVRLMNMAIAGPFLLPVDFVSASIPAYPQVVKHPMDLGTIKGRLEHGVYRNPRQIQNDVSLVWHNAIIFNYPGDPIYNQAVEIKTLFTELFEAIEFDETIGSMQEEKSPANSLTSLNLSPSVPPTIPLVANTSGKGKKKPKSILKSPPPSPVFSDEDIPYDDATGGVKEMTLKQQQQLRQSVEQLSQKQLEPIITEISRICGSYQNPVEMSFRDLSPVTLWKIHKLVADANTPPQSPVPSGGKKVQFSLPAQGYRVGRRRDFSRSVFNDVDDFGSTVCFGGGRA